jgi:heme O synthase-like polyprenyltransferase
MIRMRISMIRSRLRQVNTALPGLMLGIIVFGIICQVIGLFLADDKANYSIGLWVGVLTALLMAIHMAVTLNSTVERDEKGAQATATKQNIIRYFAVVIVLGVLMMTEIGNPLAAFLGVMGLKVSAYIQPLFIKMSHSGQISMNETTEDVKTE